MSVSRAGDGGFEGLDIQVMDVDFKVQSDTTTGVYNVPQYDSFEPLGGLSRDERAELVAIVGQVAASHEAIGGNDIPGSCKFEWEFTLDPEINGGHAASQEQNVDGITGLDVVSVNRDDPDQLQNYVLRVGNIFGQYDATAGAGSGGGASIYSSYDVQLDFRNLLGGGPVLDRHDQLYQHASVELFGDTNSEYVLSTRQTLFWDVTEE